MIVFAAYPLSETRVQREAEVLVKHGYEVDVICVRLPGEPAIDEYKGVKIYREKYRVPLALGKGSGLSGKFLKYLRFFLSASIRVTQLHFKKKYATIQVHNLPDFLVFCALIPKLLGAAVLLDLHDLMPEFYAGRFGQTLTLGARLIRLQERLACKFSDHVITVSEHWRQALIERGVPSNKISVVMNVADDQIFKPVKENHSRFQPGNGLRLIYHGAMPQRYGLDLVLQAIDRVRHDIPGIHLRLVGRGDYVPYLLRMVEELGISQCVSFEGLHLAEELPGIIQSCDLGIVPYRNDVFTDGLLPTKLMEYAALGMPAIAARTTTIQSYFQDTNVEFFEPGDVDDLARVIKNLYHDPERLAQLACGSQKFNQKYNWVVIGEAYVSLVERFMLGDSTNAG